MALTVPAAARAIPELPRDFQAAAMVSGAEGWARTSRGLYWTADGGQSWRDITPPLEHPARLGSVRFADPSRGWAISEEGGEGRNRTALFATTDGGRSWTRSRIAVKGLLTQASGAYFAPVGAHEVFALVGEARNTAYSIGYLFVSHDDGRSWHQLPKAPPHAGAISFSGPKDGWLAASGPHPSLFRTRDGGLRWSEVRLPRPAGLAGAEAAYLAPRFEPGSHGILAAAYANRGEDATDVLFGLVDGEECVAKVRCTETNQLYFSGDGGGSWAPVVRP